MEAASVAPVERRVDAAEERRVIIASSVGTVFEWYDFYLYAILANFFASLFFPPGNYTFQLLGAFGAHAAGFLVRPFGALIILVIMVIYVTMVYGPIAAFLVELFPTRIRYTSMSLPYHIGNGWFGGMLPLLATAIVAKVGNIYAGLWYPIIVSLMTLVIGGIFLHETRHLRLDDEASSPAPAAAGMRA
ncbi:MAG TPA: hypothetical protein VF973_10345 [Myxococcales bacterium]